MVDNENQGNFRKDEQQWTCSDCETINTGEYCTVCGCPRPQKKQEGSAQKTAAEQGSYEETAQEWICPNCEIHNTGETCAVCGHPRPESKEKKKRISKKAMIATVVAAVVIVTSLAGIIVWLPYHRYQNARNLLESGQYEQAYQAFSAMSDYRDSSTLRNQAVVQWADHLEKNGEYDQALNTLAYLPVDEQATEMKKQLCIQWAEELRTAGKYTLALKALEPVSELDGIPSMITVIRYSKAKWLLDDQKNYGDAYQEFIALGDYRHSKLYASEAADKWIQRTLDRPDVTQAALIRNTVKLSRSQAQNLYQELYTRDIYDYDSADGSTFSFHNDDLPVRRMLLETLPAGSYRNRAKLNTLFTELDVEQPGIFIQERRDILETLWYMPVAQNIARNDLCIDEWLLGTWRTENGSHYFKLTQADSGGYNTNFNIPWISEPAGTKYYSIYNLTYSWTDQDLNPLAEVFRFKLLEPNRIEVYAFKNQKTYTMIRK